MFSIKSMRTALIVASLLACLSGLALAQTAPEVNTRGTRAERMDKMQARKGQRDVPMQKHTTTTKTFYVALNATQKKTFGAETARRMKNMDGRMLGGKDHRRHHSQH
jgi:predicted RND superfamily exporter protein